MGKQDENWFSKPSFDIKFKSFFLEDDTFRKGSFYWDIKW